MPRCCAPATARSHQQGSPPLPRATPSHRQVKIQPLLSPKPLHASQSASSFAGHKYAIKERAVHPGGARSHIKSVSWEPLGGNVCYASARVIKGSSRRLQGTKLDRSNPSSLQVDGARSRLSSGEGKTVTRANPLCKPKFKHHQSQASRGLPRALAASIRTRVFTATSQGSCRCR